MRIPANAFMIAIGVLIALGCQSGPPPKQVAGPLRTGDLFPQIAMPAPAHPEDRTYLGLHDAETFTLKDVQANVVLVEILNTYCYSCKKQARSNNKLFSLMNSDSDTKGRIKIFGIAVGNDANEVRKFRAKYRVAYPIIPDPGFQLHSATGFTKTPYSLYMRKDPNTGSGLILGTHLGANLQYKGLFDQLSAMLSEDRTPALSYPSTGSARTACKERQFSKSEIELRVRSAFASLGGTPAHIRELPSPGSGYVYAAGLIKGGQTQTVFAVTENRTVPCDVCYDAQFLYIFDAAGKVLLFESFQLSKDDNIPWDDTDLSLIRSRILGKFIFHHFPFDPEVDAVSSATITSKVIYDGISDGQKIYEMLKGKGLLQ